MITFAHPLALILAIPLLIVALYSVLRHRRLLTRIAVISLLALAMAGPQLVEELRSRRVVFLVDRSRSVAASSSWQQAVSVMESVISANDLLEAEIVAFAESARSLQLNNRALASLDTPSFLGENTNLLAAVDLALAGTSSSVPAELVLLSDGQFTEGLTEAIGTAKRSSVPIHTIGLGSRIDNDVRIDKLDAPEEVEVGRPFTVQVELVAHKEVEANLTLYRNGKLIVNQNVELDAGRTVHKVEDLLRSTAPSNYQAVVKAEGDTIAENDTLSTLTRVKTTPSLLVIQNSSTETFTNALDAIGKRYVTVSSVPQSVYDLLSFQEIALVNVPLDLLTRLQINSLREFVNDVGGGLFVVGGKDQLQGFAGGGIEDILPVTFTVPQEAREAGIAVVYLLDRSSSMRGRAHGVAKIDILKESAAASVNLLDERALVGIIGFNRTFDWLVDIQQKVDGKAIYDGLRGLEADGGTDIYYPLVDAFSKLQEVEARAKHIVLFSDGKTVDEYRDFPQFLSRLETQQEIVLSAIGIGLTPNVELLGTLVAAGEGSLYIVDDFSTLPEISIEATQRLSRSRFIGGEIEVRGLLNRELGSIPPLQGTALTYPRPTAEVLLHAGDDPLLCRWQYGLGQVGFLSTDLSGEWSRNWFSWSKAGLLAESLLATVEPASVTSSMLRPTVELAEDSIVVRVDARDEEGNFANFLDVGTSLLPTNDKFELSQTGPGLYGVTMPIQPEGGYAIAVYDETRDLSASLSFSIPYSDEYRTSGVNTKVLNEIASSTGGRFLKDEILPDRLSETTMLNEVDIHHYPLWAALVLFLGELVVRKLPFASRH